MRKKHDSAPLLCLIAASAVLACSASAWAASPEVDAGEVGVLLVSHGSHSAQWRGMLTDLHVAVEESLLAHPRIAGVKTAFMEYTEPSIATGLKDFDSAGYSEVILVPLLLTVSSHSFDDIPTIYGAKDVARSREALRAEGIERYTPRARVTMTPLLDYAELLEGNLARRVAALSENPSEEGVVLVAYGSEPYDEEWTEAFATIAGRVEALTGAGPVLFAWCGHIVHYDKQPTQDAIHTVLAKKQRALVIPALVARDEAFQDRIIGGAVTELHLGERIAYRPDSVLPDHRLNEWIVSIVHRTVDSLPAATARTDRSGR